MEQSPGPSSASSSKPVPVSTSTSVAKKATRKSLKHLLESRPIFSDAQKCATTALAAEETTQSNKVAQNNEYVLNPVGSCTFFVEEELLEYIEDFKSNATDHIFIS